MLCVVDDSTDLFGREVVVDLLVFVEILATKEPDKVPLCLLAGQLIQVLRAVTSGGYPYGGFAALFSRSRSRFSYAARHIA